VLDVALALRTRAGERAETARTMYLLFGNEVSFYCAIQHGVRRRGRARGEKKEGRATHTSAKATGATSASSAAARKGARGVIVAFVGRSAARFVSVGVPRLDWTLLRLAFYPFGPVRYS